MGLVMTAWVRDKMANRRTAYHMPNSKMPPNLFGNSAFTVRLLLLGSAMALGCSPTSGSDDANKKSASLSVLKVLPEAAECQAGGFLQAPSGTTPGGTATTGYTDIANHWAAAAIQHSSLTSGEAVFVNTTSATGTGTGTTTDTSTTFNPSGNLARVYYVSALHKMATKLGLVDSSPCSFDQFDQATGGLPKPADLKAAAGGTQSSAGTSIVDVDTLSCVSNAATAVNITELTTQACRLYKVGLLRPILASAASATGTGTTGTATQTNTTAPSVRLNLCDDVERVDLARFMTYALRLENECFQIEITNPDGTRSMRSAGSGCPPDGSPDTIEAALNLLQQGSGTYKGMALNLGTYANDASLRKALLLTAGFGLLPCKNANGCGCAANDKAERGEIAAAFALASRENVCFIHRGSDAASTVATHLVPTQDKCGSSTTGQPSSTTQPGTGTQPPGM